MADSDEVATADPAVGLRAVRALQRLQERLEAAMSTLGDDEVVFLVDLAGATPFNLCCRRCGGGQFAGLECPADAACAGVGGHAVGRLVGVFAHRC